MMKRGLSDSPSNHPSPPLLAQLSALSMSATQVLYHLSPAPVLFCFKQGLVSFCLGTILDHDPPTYDSFLAETTGAIPPYTAYLLKWGPPNILPSWPKASILPSC
jgi:hypothetical protein